MDHAGSSYCPEGDTTTTSDQTPKNQRSMRSLNVLATRFVRLIQEAKGCELDLKDAVRILAVGQKRRIYDITNVLEGVGLIVKVSKNNVKWKGGMPGEHAQAQRITELKLELEDLEQKEYMLDQQKFWVEQSIRNTTEDCSNLTYVNYDDICNCFSGHTLLAVQAPSGTQLDVPIPKAVQDSPAKYQIHLKSINGPIDVLLLNKLSVGSVPVVLPVPPPEDILCSAKLAMSTSEETKSSIAPCQAPANTKNSTRPARKAMEDIIMRHLQSSPFVNTEPNRTDASGFRVLTKELEDLLQPTKEKLNSGLITELMASEVFSPLLRLSPPPTEKEYVCNLNDSEGLCDLFDIPVLNV